MNPLRENNTHVLVLDGVELDVVRTGVPADGNCFFHCLLRALDKSFKSLSSTEKNEQIADARKKCAKMADKNFERLADGELKRMLFISQLRCELERGITGQHPLTEELTKHLTPEYLQKVFEKSVGTPNVSRDFLKRLLGKIDVYYHKYITKWFEHVSSRAERHARQKYCASLMEMGRFVEQKHLECISRTFRVNLLFIDSKTGKLYKDACQQINSEWDTVVLLWIEECHYELVGIMDENHYVVRKFSPRHPFLAQVVSCS